MLLTVNQLEEISPYTHFKRLELILPNLNATLEKYDIKSNLRISHFLTQLVIESSHFRYIQEPGTGKLYENSTELGNNKLGDGRRFISRGYITFRIILSIYTVIDIISCFISSFQYL